MNKDLLRSLVPGLLLIGVGLLDPDRALLYVGAAIGWIVVSQLIFRPQVQTEYRTAIQHLRRNKLADAVTAMDAVIEAEPDNPNHRQFRAELNRLTGHLDNARLDYEQMIRLKPDAAAGYTGLAEVCAQQGDFERAHEFALKALEREPKNWMALYNMGLIADRLGQSEQAVTYLENALAAGVPHSRYRLLTRLWLARNHYRQGNMEIAQQQLDLMSKQRDGLEDWQIVFESEQAAPLRHLLEADVSLAQQILENNASLKDL